MRILDGFLLVIACILGFLGTKLIQLSTNSLDRWLGIVAVIGGAIILLVTLLMIFWERRKTHAH